MNKKGNLTIYFVFMAVALVTVLIAAVLAPMGVLFNTEAYRAGEKILKQANGSIQQIQDGETRAAVNGALDNAFAAGQNNIDVNANIFQYGWIFVIILSGIVLFLLFRRTTEVGGGLA